MPAERARDIVSCLACREAAPACARAGEDGGDEGVHTQRRRERVRASVTALQQTSVQVKVAPASVAGAPCRFCSAFFYSSTRGYAPLGRSLRSGLAPDNAHPGRLKHPEKLILVEVANNQRYGASAARGRLRETRRMCVSSERAFLDSACPCHLCMPLSLKVQRLYLRDGHMAY